MRGAYGPAVCDPCVCQKITSLYINPIRISRLQISRPTLCCNKQEIFVTLKTGQIVCVDPDAKWINKIIANVRKNKANYISMRPGRT
ncbi:C-X-C motif chemokine 6-like isoform X2 [Rhinatrema bivittatum]|uniref:C-X-C motif chemokine 6-like isoform X2 n=1 Tax=Rhinatrema bivittatum TaxID=194408 RepID=UPI00112B48D0|nr:C-X-C motif chemokine 6-like isoform X2 [Rhinatrema bivittatum]